MDPNDDQQRGSDPRQGRDEQGLRGRQIRSVEHKPGKQHGKRRHEPDDHGMAAKDPLVQTRGAATEEVISGKNRNGRDGREDVSGELGLGEGEEKDGNEGPQHQEFREGIAGAAGLFPGIGGVAQPPFGDRGLDPVNQGPEGNHRPRHDSQNDNHNVIPEGVWVLVAVGGETGDILLHEEFVEEGGVGPLHGDKPGQHDGEIEEHAGPPERASDNRPLAAQGRECTHDDDGQKRSD